MELAELANILVLGLEEVLEALLDEVVDEGLLVLLGEDRDHLGLGDAGVGVLTYGVHEAVEVVVAVRIAGGDEGGVGGDEERDGDEDEAGRRESLEPAGDEGAGSCHHGSVFQCVKFRFPKAEKNVERSS